MTIRNLFLSGFFLSLVACNNGSSGSSEPKQDLHAAAKAAPALSPEQKQKIIALSKNDSALLPSTELLFNTYQNTQDRDKDIAVLNDDGKNLLSRINSNCTISPERETTTGEPGVGKTFTREKNKWINGSNCPISYSEKSISTETVTSIDEANQSGSGTVSISSDVSARVLDTEIKKKVYSTGHDIHSEIRISFSNYKTDRSGKLVSGSAQGSLNSSQTIFTSTGEQAVGTATGEFTHSSAGGKIQILINLKFPEGFTFVFGLFVDGSNTEIIVNGESYTKESYYETFGTWFKIPDLDAQTK